MTKLTDIAATLAILSQQFAALELDGNAPQMPPKTPTGAGIPLPPERRAEIKELLKLNARASRPIPMTTISKLHGVSRPTLYALKKELEKDRRTTKATTQ